MNYKVSTDTATIGIFTLDSIATDVYGEDYDQWLDIFSTQPYVEYVISVDKYKDKGVIINTGYDGKFNVNYNDNKIIIPITSSIGNKYVYKFVSTLEKTKYLLICSTESMFDYKIKYKKIISMMKKNNKKIHKFQNGGGIIIKVSNTPKNIKLISNKKIIYIKIE